MSGQRQLRRDAPYGEGSREAPKTPQRPPTHFRSYISFCNLGYISDFSFTKID